jgi:TolA-binding protein
MSQRGFFGGFLLGALVGGAVGGVVGALASARLAQSEKLTEGVSAKLEGRAGKGRQPLPKVRNEQTMEAARRGLEDKIAQLNEAIDDVRQQLGSMNGKTEAEREAIAPDP